MNYYLAKTDNLEKIVDLRASTTSTMDYIQLTTKYPQLLTGEYILLSEGDSPKSKRNTYWGIPFDDDEYEDETTGFGNFPYEYYDDDDEYGDETTGWGE